MKIIGISAMYHDSAAVLIDSGNILSANQEERFSRIKHDSSFPYLAIKECLKQSGLSIKDIDAFVFYEKPYAKFERITDTIYAFAPRGFISFREFVKNFSIKKFSFEENLKELGLRDNVDILYSSHHLSHAASAFFPSPFEESAVITADGVGEYSTTTISKGYGNLIDIIKEMRFPHSVGLFYSAFTYFLGFKVNYGEYKLMGLAPYGRVKEAENFKYKIKKEIIDIKEDGSIFLNQSYFNYCTGNTMINEKKFFNLFSFKKRNEKDEIEQKHCDLALAVQEILNEIMVKLAVTAKRITGMKNLCIAGGVGLNCVSNSKIYDSGAFENIWVQPASGDAGGALGAAFAVYYIHYKNKRTYRRDDMMQGCFLGAEYSNEEIKKTLDEFNADYEYIETDKLIEKTAELILDGMVIGWFQGRMEWGPRALGNRSIIADPRVDDMQKKINMKIKYREGFRPFAPAVIEEFADKYFNPSFYSPYMLFISTIREELRNKLPQDYEKKNMWEKLYLKKSFIPAVTHVDFSARIQTVRESDNPLFYRVIYEFYKKTGCPLVLNTSFNVRGEPIVASPSDAYKCFTKTDMDYLVIGNFVLDKKKQRYKDTLDIRSLND